MTRKLLLILLALVLVIPLGCATKAKAPEQPLQVYSTDMENQGFSNLMMEVDELLAKCKDKAMKTCPDTWNEAKRLRDEGYAAWVRCDSAQAWDLLKQALAKAKEACECEEVVVIEEAKPIVLQWDHALFDFDKYNIRPDAAKVLDQVAADMMANPEVQVAIFGYTDSIGTTAYNDQLSVKRAISAEDYLVKKGISRDRIKSIKGKGELFPVAPNKLDGRDNPTGRQQNRRVEVVQYKMP
jgi:outer membrane protein OmpA-like peptidoglycan-associated protein